MKRILILLMLVFLVGCSDENGVKPIKKSLDVFNLKGDVKHVTTYYGDGISINGAIKDDCYFIEEYSREGMVTNRTLYDNDSTVLDLEVWHYLEDNRIDFIEFSNLKRHNCSSIEYKYHPNGKLHKKIFNDSTIFPSMETGTLTMEIQYSQEGLEEKIIYSNNIKGITNENICIYEDGIKVREEHHDVINDHFSNTIYEYDNNGNVILQQTKDPNGRIGTTYKYDYDRYGNVIFYEYSYEGQVIYSYNCVYKYDNYNNWIEEIRYVDDNQVSKTIREIEYYLVLV